nr:hypothetical protein BaRGS_017278 [Batillaria attramentaria]
MQPLLVIMAELQNSCHLFYWDVRLSPDEIMAETKRFVEVSKQIHSFEERNVTKNFNLKKDQLKDVTETHKQLEQHYKKATEKVAKEKADVDKMQNPSTRAFFSDQQSFDEKMTKEQEEYLEAVSEQEVAKKQMDGIAEQKQQLEKEVATLGKKMESLMKLYDEQDAILGRIFNGAYGSELENKLEAEFDAILERKERIMVAKYKWTNARILLQHAVNQLGVACGKCSSGIPLTSWVIKNTIGKDLENAKKELAPKEKALREERLRLIKERMGGDADGITLGDGAQGKQSKEASKTQVTPDPGGVAKVTRQYKAGDPVYALYYGPHHAKQPRWVPAVVKKSTGDFDGDDDELDPELVAIMKPAKPEGTEGGDDELFGNIEQLKQQHEKEMAEFEKAQETNKARIEQGLQEKLRQRRNRRTRLAAD